MPGQYKLILTNPDAGTAYIDYGRHFKVDGEISGDLPLPTGSRLTVMLCDGDGRLLRYARSAQAGTESYDFSRPDFTAYPDGADADFTQLRRFGFPELIVTDPTRPDRSIRNATVKCLLGETRFRGLIVSATDADRGLTANDGMGYTDADGRPYTALPCGNYTLVILLTSGDGSVLARLSRQIAVSVPERQAIARFNPKWHRLNMIEWYKERGLPVDVDCMPGYLEPYLGRWYRHMGLLTMYRACDLSRYVSSRVELFDYLIDPSSTSYETELAYMQANRLIDSRLTVFRYDIGEARISDRTGRTLEGKIRAFTDAGYMAVCRIDTVNGTARENFLNLDGSGIERMNVGRDGVFDGVFAGERVAVTGVIRPYQLNPDDFTPLRENIYGIKNRVTTLIYDFEVGGERFTDTRELLMERYDNGSIGRSVFEFYNVFEIPERFAGMTARVRIRGLDARGGSTPVDGHVTVRIG